VQIPDEKSRTIDPALCRISPGEKGQSGAIETNENRHTCGNFRRDRIERILQQRDSVNDRRETCDHPGDKAAKFAVDGALRGHDAIKRQGLNVPDTRQLDTEFSEDHVSDLCGVLERIHLHARAAFDDASIKEPLRRRHGEKRGHLLAAAGLPEDKDSARIAAEIGNVVAHPGQRSNDIEHAYVAGGLEQIAGVAEVRIAEPAEVVIDCDDHDIATTARFAPSYSGAEPEPEVNAPP
jgi:hypothetical protein